MIFQYNKSLRVRILNASTAKFARSISEPYPEPKENENESYPDVYLTVQVQRFLIISERIVWKNVTSCTYLVV